jgi:hypothetical protein
MKTFYYVTGEQVLIGDRISVASKQGAIENILMPETEDAKDFDCKETGGLLINFEDGDLQLWSEVDEDLMFVDRDCHRTGPSAA